MIYFADTFYLLALFNHSDPAHARARVFAQSRRADIFTTEYVLLEFANALCSIPNRAMAAELIRRFYIRPDVRILPANPVLFGDALDLYKQRLDKDWSLTDCTSFVVMRQNNIPEALTGDHHFEQAGSTALLK